MDNPWKHIGLDDYENHMKSDSVMQLRAMNEMMKDQIYRYGVSAVMILGIAGGNGLNHIVPDKFKKVYGVDVNPQYLKECVSRYPDLKNVFQPIATDLIDETLSLPHADLVVANLLIEYIGYDAFRRAVLKVGPEYVSCIIQVDTDGGFVSDSPYIHVFDRLEKVHRRIDKTDLTENMKTAGYELIFTDEKPLPNGKKLVRLDYQT